MSSVPPHTSDNDRQRSRDSLLRGLKHELRTPLNAILGFADLLLGELDGPLSADERENVTMVRQSGGSLLALINDVLDLSTALVQPVEPVYEDLDVVSLLELLRIGLEQRRGVRLVYLRVASLTDSVDVRADQRLLTRALRCLGEIALEQTTAGEIVLEARLEHETLVLWVRADGFRSSAGALGVDLQELMTGDLRRFDRPPRIAALKLAIATRLLARHGSNLSIEREGDQLALCVRMPLGAAISTVISDASNEADVTLALTYIAAMSHDLRTPLNAILGFSDLLSMEATRTWSVAQERSFAIVRERAGDLFSLVDDMIDWAKLEAGELALDRGPVQVKVLVARIRDAALSRAGSRGLQLSASVDAAADVCIKADPARLVQAVLGLLDHAIRTSHGAVVQIRVQRMAADVHLIVEDPGLCIRPEDQQGVFDAFRPSHAPTGQRIAGLQLGPSVARSLLRAHGGDVWFESRPGRGTTFTARLPL